MRKETKSQIQVAIRVRPLIKKELDKKELETLMVDNNQIMAYDPIDRKYNNKHKNDVIHRSRTQQFAFDNIFTSQPIQEIYSKTAQTLIDPLFNGYNSCVFAYGATGTGKTHTMLGNKDSNDKGIIYMCLEEIFHRKKQIQKDYDVSITVSYVEIYNENIRDLLVNNKKNKYLCLRDSSSKNVKIAGAKVISVENTNDIMQLLYQGNERRVTEATGANKVSSRSHAIFQLYYQCIEKQQDGITKGKKKFAKLSLIDLAGSERGSKTKNKGKRMEEGANINKSLLALANCINALRDKKKGSYINYRDSKLTRLLKDSLGGKSLTVMIVTVSPASSQFEESINTLKYANRAKEIKTRAIQNEKIIKFQRKGFQDVIDEINNETQQLTKNFLKRAQEVVKQKINHQKKKQQKNLSPKEEAKKMRQIKQELLDNFDQRIQIVKALIEIKAINDINETQIAGNKMQILTFTMQQTGQFLQEQDFNKVNIKDLPENMAIKKKEIDLLKDSTQDNLEEQNKMIQELQQLHKESEKIMMKIEKYITDVKNKEILYLIIQNKLQQMKMNEFKYNLKLQQRLNLNLQKKIMLMQQIGEENGLYLDDLEVDKIEEEEEDLINDSDLLDDDIEVIEDFISDSEDDS